jgi:hypothetical protein
MYRLALFIILAAAQAQAQEKPFRVYFVGNSVTDTINYRGLAELAKSRGHQQIWGRHMIPGAPLQWIWQHPKDGFQEPPFGHYPNALANFQWDVLSLQPFDRHLDGKDGDLVMAKNFIDLALPKSPDLQVYVYARWPRQGKDDFDTAWLKKYTGGWDNTNETKDYFERLTLELTKAYPKLKIRMVPVGHVLHELNQRMKAGQVPGYKAIKEVFADGIHLNNVGSYVVGCTFFATLYKENPKGLPGEPYKVHGKLAEVIQETVWKVVSANELAGVAILADSFPAAEQQPQPATVEVTKSSTGVTAQKAYVPEPQPVTTQILVGAHNCPLWEADQPQMWNQVLKHPERTPSLGFYSQENPEVADWETKWAVEHGISFFVYCWYRNGQGGPVKMHFGSAIHDALLKSRYVSKMKFTIMWENQARGTAGVSGEADLMENLLPFWVENYFRHPSYLKIDNKPLLFIYRPEFLVQDLGGVDKVRAALDKMRAACRKAGFDGLYILGEYRGLDPKHLELMKSLGLDYTFAYCWYVAGSPKPEQAIAAQLDSINKTRRMGILPEVVTVSQGWSGWQDEGSIWKIPPVQYKELLEKAKAIIRTFPATELGSKILLLDNWNEWSEGHYIAPHREYGFGYLDAVREVFSDTPKNHVDLLPSDVGMGPYDQAYKQHVGPRK